MNRYEKYALKNNISIEQARYELKTHSKAYKEYWISRGYSEEEATLELSKRNKRTKIYWTSRGYSEEEAKIKIQENSPQTKIYWTSRGYSEEEAKNKIKQFNSQCKEYWIAKGYSEEEAKEKANRNAKKRNIQCKEYWIAKGYSEEEAKEKVCNEKKKNIGRILNNYSKDWTKTCKEYWIAKGYSEEEAKEKAKQFNRSITSNISFETRSKASKNMQKKYSKEKKKQIGEKISNAITKYNKTHSPIFKEYWISRGYSEEEAKKQSANTRFSSKENISRSSKIELKCLSELSQFLNTDIVNQRWFKFKNNLYCADGYIKNKKTIIEFNGTYFHLDSRFYTENQCNPKNKTYNCVHSYDEEKKNTYCLNGYNLIVIWEYDFLNFKDEVFNLIKNFLNDNEKNNKKGICWDSASFFNKC